MRVGVNPEKNKGTLLTHKSHRIIVPFWIPNVEDEYFRNQPEVLRLCLDSLIKSIDPSQTNITLINNHSCLEAKNVALEFVARGLIDKYVERVENRGKLENVLAEARASFEEYITICDADFLFFEGWEDAIISVFKNIGQAGVVTCYPCPNLAFNYNSYWVLSSRWNIGKVIDDRELALVEMGLGNNDMNGIYSGFGVRRKYKWRDRQYYIKGQDVLALPGAVHALATMKRDIIDSLPHLKVEYVFKNGYEQKYLDYFSERMGYFRLSTPVCWAYHMGNSIPCDLIDLRRITKRTCEKFPQYKKRFLWSNNFCWFFYNIIVRVLRKMNLL